MERETENLIKKDADDTSAIGNEALKKMVGLISQLNLEMKKLHTIAINNQNTRKDIKDCVYILRDLTSQLSAAELTKELAVHEGKKNKSTETNEVATQTEPRSHNTARDGITQEQVKAVQKYEDFVAIKNANWPLGIFARSRHVEGAITQAGREEDILVWDEGNSAGPQTKRVLGKYPELGEKKDEYAQLYVTTKMRDSKGKESQKEQVITQRVADGSERHCYAQLEAMKTDMMKSGREAIAIYPPRNDGNGVIVQKMVECIFGNTGIQCKVYFTTKGENKTSERKVNGNTGAVIVSKTEGKSFAELLRAVKDGMKGKEEMTKGIRSIRQTRNGDMLITTKNGTAGVDEIKKVLEETAEISTRINKTAKGGDGVVIFVKGMDAVTTKDEVREALIEAGEMTSEPKIGELRPYYGSSQAVTVTLPGETAQKLLKKKELRVGYNWCRVTKRVEVIQCYRCWRYGHKAAGCKSGEDRSKDCRNCGDKGHLQKECTLQRYCPICKRQGHSAGTGGCPATRQALRQARTEQPKTKKQGTGWVNLKEYLSGKP